jgi:hypothetical protein
MSVRPLERREPGEKMKYKDLSANIVAFISRRHRLTQSVYVYT